MLQMFCIVFQCVVVCCSILTLEKWRNRSSALRHRTKGPTLYLQQLREIHCLRDIQTMYVIVRMQLVYIVHKQKTKSDGAPRLYAQFPAEYPPHDVQSLLGETGVSDI